MNRPAAGGLRELVRHIVQRDVLRASAAKSRGWMVLVLDAAAARVLTPVLGLYDLVEERVTLVESLEKKRQPFPDMTAVYVVAATSESVARVAADWRGPTADPYADAHVFTLDALGDGEMGALREMARKLRALVELRLDFLALEARAFSLDEPRAFRVAPGAARGAALDAPRDAACARKLANLLATLGAGAGVVVRHRAGNARARACGARLLDELARGGGGDGGGGGGAAPGVVVLLVDRADDVLTPLVHEYSYQALVQDVLPVEGAARDRVRVADAAAPGAPPPDDAYVLSDRDALWVELRHAHVAAVVRRLRARTRAVLASHRGAADLRRGRGGDLSLGEMAAALRRLPEFRAATARLDAHMTLARAALAEFQRHRLLEQSQLERLSVEVMPSSLAGVAQLWLTMILAPEDTCRRAMPLLGLNECAAVRQWIAHSEGLGQVVELGGVPDASARRYEQKLIHVTSAAVIQGEPLMDPETGILPTEGTFILRRNVEMLQWVESRDKNGQENDAGAYSYSLQWRAETVLSKTFHDRTKMNPVFPVLKK